MSLSGGRCLANRTPYQAVDQRAGRVPQRRAVTVHQPFRSRPAAQRRCTAATVASAAGTTAEASPVDTAAGVLRLAADERTNIKRQDVFKALTNLDKQKLKGDDSWGKVLGGEKSPGRRWRLVYTVGKDELAKDRKGEAEAKGKYFPLTAAQQFDASTGKVENGVFLGHVASLTFLGPYDFTKNKLAFNYWKLNIKLGPWKFGFDIKKGDKDAPFDAQDKKLPFFVFFYVDEHIAVAKGRGGGWAYWARTDPKWELEHGIV